MQIDMNRVACTEKVDVKYNHRGFDTAVPETISKNPYLPLVDIAVLTYILSNRVNAKKNRWDLHESEVIHHFALTASRYKINKAFKDLQRWGYLIKRCVRNNQGQYVSTGKWIFLRHPTGKNIHKAVLKDRRRGSLRVKQPESRLRGSRQPDARRPDLGFQTPNMTQANMTQQNIDQKNVQQQQLPKISNQKSNNGSMQTRSYAVAQTPNRDPHKIINRSLKSRSANIQDLNANKKKKEPKGNETRQEDHLTDQELSEIDYIMSLIHQQFHITPTKSDWKDVTDWCSQYGSRIVGYGIDYTVNQATKGTISNPVHYITAVLANGWYYKYLKQAKVQHKTNQKMKDIHDMEELNAESRICSKAINNYKGRQSTNIFQHKSTDKTMKQASSHNINYKQLYERTFTPVEDTRPQDETALKIQAIYRNFDQLGIYACGASFALAFLVNYCWSLNDIRIEFKHTIDKGYRGLKAMDYIRKNAIVSVKQ